MSYEIAEKYIRKADALEYPAMPERPKREDFPSHAAYGAAVDEFEVLRDGVKAKRKEYDIKQGEITEQFKRALGKEYGVINHPKFERAFGIAWEYGHSSGYSEVAGYFGTLAELLVSETDTKIGGSSER